MPKEEGVEMGRGEREVINTRVSRGGKLDGNYWLKSHSSNAEKPKIARGGV